MSCKPRLHVSVNLSPEYDRALARLGRRRAYAPASKTASHENYEKI